MSTFKKATVITSALDEIEITAPDDKTMAIDTSALAHGILLIGEFGQSGVKVAAFRNWEQVRFGAEEHGYVISNAHPF